MSSITRRAALVAIVPVAAIRSAAQDAGQPLSLTSEQRRTTEMLVDRIIPADELGPGALECGAANYIDVQMSGYLAPQKDAWVAGLTALDAYAIQSQGAKFAELSAERRDAVLISLPQNLQQFFNQARTYTLQGTFGDPHYGGNTNGKGWDIIRYPGPRPATSAEMQRMDQPAMPYRRSAWGLQ